MNRTLFKNEKMKLKWIITMSCIGVAAYVLADLFHEVVGHGGTCLLAGHQIDLITSVYFKSSPGSFLTDLGGPLSNLFFGFLVFFFLERRNNISVVFALLLVNTMCYNLFWFSGTILQSVFSKTGDWKYAVNELNIGVFERPVLLITGMTAYFLSIKLTRRHLKGISLNFIPLKQSLFYSYFAGVIAAVIAGLFFKYDRIHAALEGLLEMIASLPIIFIFTKEKTKIDNYEFKPSLVFNVTILILFITFCLSLGRGLILTKHLYIAK